jgi:hypothetical protein
MLWTLGLAIVLVWFSTCLIGLIIKSMKVRADLLTLFITFSALVLGYFLLSG